VLHWIGGEMLTLGEIKAVGKWILPPRAQRLMRNVCNRDMRAASRVMKCLGGTKCPHVRSGPFKGMSYVTNAVGSELVPKVVGTYEKELANVIEAACTGDHDMFIDIGAAEGYFAVGLAWRSRQVPCTAFEMEAAGRRLIARMAQLNGVESLVEIRGECTRAELLRYVGKHDRPFVLCDCEGGELELLDPVAVPELRKATMLVEVHGRVELPPGKHADHPSAMGALLTDRFWPTHSVNVIPIQPRIASDWPAELAGISTPLDRLCAMREHRSAGPGWLYLQPR
jgi:hypothetical protein